MNKAEIFQTMQCATDPDTDEGAMELMRGIMYLDPQAIVTMNEENDGADIHFTDGSLYSMKLRRALAPQLRGVLKAKGMILQ